MMIGSFSTISLTSSHPRSRPFIYSCNPVNANTYGLNWFLIEKVFITHITGEFINCNSYTYNRNRVWIAVYCRSYLGL